MFRSIVRFSIRKKFFVALTTLFLLAGGIYSMLTLPFSISAGVGFIALFGVAVLNGILMINYFNDKRHSTRYHLCTDRILSKGCSHLLCPVFLTGMVASLGFVPMAVATSAGAEVQRPLATVVIGGLVVSTVLTLVIIPVFYRIVNVTPVALHRLRLKGGIHASLLVPALMFAGTTYVQGQETATSSAGHTTINPVSLQEKGIMDYLPVTSPLTGYVTNVDVNIGKYLDAGEPICDVIDKRAPLLQLTVYEKELSQMRTGRRVLFRVNGMGTQSFEAKVVSIDQSIDEKDYSVKVYAQVLTAHNDFCPGMYVRAKLLDSEGN